MTTNIKHFEVIGASRRCLVLNIEDNSIFCSTKNYAYLCKHPDTKWDIIKQPAHEDIRTGKYYPETQWLQIYKPTLF